MFLMKWFWIIILSCKNFNSQSTLSDISTTSSRRSIAAVVQMDQNIYTPDYLGAKAFCLERSHIIFVPLRLSTSTKENPRETSIVTLENDYSNFSSHLSNGLSHFFPSKSIMLPRVHRTCSRIQACSHHHMIGSTWLLSLETSSSILLL